MKALSSKGNIFQVGNAKNFRQDLYVVLDRDINFSPSLGFPVHGIMGYDLFRDLVVEVNYGSQVIKLHDPGHYRPRQRRKDQTIPWATIAKRPIVNGQSL